MDRFLATLIYFLVSLARHLPFETWRPGRKLKLLLIGYNGKRNAGADLCQMDRLDRCFYSAHYFHGHLMTMELAVQAGALLHNFTPIVPGPRPRNTTRPARIV